MAVTHYIHTKCSTAVQQKLSMQHTIALRHGKIKDITSDGFWGLISNLAQENIMISSAF